MVISTQNNPDYIPQRGDVIQISFDPQKRVEILMVIQRMGIMPWFFQHQVLTTGKGCLLSVQLLPLILT